MLTFLIGGKNFCWKFSLVFKSIFVVFWGLLKSPVLISACYLTQQMCVKERKSQVLIFVNLPCYGMFNGKLLWPLNSKAFALCEISLLKPYFFEKSVCKVKIKHLNINSLILNGYLKKKKRSSE